MAKAIQYTPHVPTPSERLETATFQAEPALAEALELLSELHRHGALDLALKLLRGGDHLAAAALDKVTGDSGTAIIRNVVELGKLASRLDPAKLEILLSAVGGGVEQAARSIEAGERLTPAGALRQLTDPDIQLALGAVFGLLRGMGRTLRVEREQRAQGQGE